MKFWKKHIFLGRLPLKGRTIIQPQKGTFPIPIPEFRKHSLKILSKSVDNYYLLAFMENLKNTPKKRDFVFFSVTNKKFEKLRGGNTHDFFTPGGPPVVKQYSWRSAASR